MCIRMGRGALGALLCLATAGCTGDALATFLTGFEIQELEDNLTTSVEAQNAAAEYGYAIARGEADLTGATYDPPTAANNWFGTVTFPPGTTTLPFSPNGALTFVFNVLADGVPVDPYDAAADVPNANNVVIDALFDFDGIAPGAAGLPMSILADLVITSTVNNPGFAQVDLSGPVTVDVDGFVTELDVTNLTADIDTAAQQITNVTGQVQGVVDLPNRFFDATFDVDGLGTTLDIGVRAASSVFDFVVAI